MMTCVLCYSSTESPKDPLGSARSPNHGWPRVFFLCRLLCLSFEEWHTVGIIQLQPSGSTSFTQSFASACLPYCLMAHCSTGQHSTSPGVPQLLHSPKEEYLLASKFGWLWIKLPSTFMCSFLCGHTFSADLGKGQGVCSGWMIQVCVSFHKQLPCHLAGGQVTLCFLLWCRSTPTVSLLPASLAFGAVCVLGSF